MKNTKTAVTLVIISFVVLTISTILLNYTSARISFIRYINLFLIVASALTMFAITYSLLIKRFKRTENVIDQKEYAKLYDLENSQFGEEEIQFYFTIERSSPVIFSILNKKLEAIFVLKDEVVQSGGHIIRFDPKQLEKEVYYYSLKTDNQQTMKKFWIS